MYIILLYIVGAEDIVNGSRKLILGLIWQYILRYQIGKTEVRVYLNPLMFSTISKNFVVLLLGE